MERPHLLRQRHFLPFFLTQFLGAMNDNLFKTVILISFTLIAAEQAGIWNNFAHMAFVLPFFLFSASSGYYADQVEKSQWIRKIKLLEIIIMGFGIVCLWYDWLWGLIVLLFLMGTQSTLFGPVKYSIIPQHVTSHELTSANAWVELGTFLAILLGNLWAGLVFEFANPKVLISVSLITFAIVGYLTARGIPQAPSLVAIGKKPQKFGTLALIQRARQHKSLFLSMLGVSWFWFLGSAYLTQLPVFTSQYLNSSESVIALFLVAFSIGVGGGSLLTSLLSCGKVEIGLVPIGAFGLGVFGAYLGAVPALVGPELQLMDALQSPTHWQVFGILIGLGVSGGLYIVPLYGMIQTRSPEDERAQMIAANNIINALFMVGAAIFGLVTLGLLEMPLNQFFWALVLLNCAVTIYIFTLVPEFVARFLVWGLVHLIYRVKQVDVQSCVPETGPAVLIANHVSYVDAFFIGGLVHRPTRFVMYKPIYDIPVLNFIFRALKAIPIDSKIKNPAVYEAAFDQISAALENNELVVIFPEGKLTFDGEVDEFKPGLLKILQRNPVPVVPMALQGLWGSFFSHKGGKALFKRPRRLFAKVVLLASKPWVCATVAADSTPNDNKQLIDINGLREEVLRLTRVVIL